MKFYLSSYKLGDRIDKLRELIPGNNKTAYIPNSLDFSDDLERRRKDEKEDISQLQEVGLDAELLDLRNYFGKEDKLRKRIEDYGAIWVRGGNVFVLRQAMKLSGFDNIVKDLHKQNKNILYGGYSAGVCVLGPTLKGIEIIDDASQEPYEDIGILWEGLGILDYCVAPHYKSEHKESDEVKEYVEYLIENKMLFKVLRDGEVIVTE